MWRPGKLRFLIGVKNPLPIGRSRPLENTAPCRAAPIARFATPVGLRPPFVTHPATLSLILIDALFSSSLSRSSYRLKRYRSNGTNSTIRGGYWPNVIVLDEPAREKASLRPDYEQHLATLLLNKPKRGREDTRPNMTEIAVWYFRMEDVEPLVSVVDNAEQKLTALTDEFTRRFGLTPNEIDE